MKPLLQVHNLKTHYFSPKGTVKAVNDISFEIKEGEGLGLVGESGCGKSTTAYSILRLIEPPGQIVGGEVIFENKNILQMSSYSLAKIRGKKIFMIFQDSMNSLNPMLTIGSQIAEAIAYSGHLLKSSKDITEKSIEVLKQVDMPDPPTVLKQYPHQLSGGMQQRVMIAMGLAMDSSLLLMDEPTTALDVTIQFKILALINQIQEEKKLSFLLVTHDLGVAAKLCRKVAVMYAGKIVEQGPYEEVLNNPLHPYSLGLFECTIKPAEKKEYLKTIEGFLPSLINLPPGCLFANRCQHSMKLCQEEKPEIIDVGNRHVVACHRVQANEAFV